MQNNNSQNERQNLYINKYFDDQLFLENNHIESFSTNFDDILHESSYTDNNAIVVVNNKNNNSNNNNKKRKSIDNNDNDINEIDNSNKKRFLWPESLHRDFIAAVFDIGLKLATPAKLKELLPDINIATNDEMTTQISKLKLFRKQKRSCDYKFMHNTNDDTTLNDMHYDVSNSVLKKEKIKNHNNAIELNNLTSISIERANYIVSQIESIGLTLNAQSDYLTNVKQSFSKQVKLYTQLTIKAAQLKNFILENSSTNALQDPSSPSFNRVEQTTSNFESTTIQDNNNYNDAHSNKLSFNIDNIGKNNHNHSSHTSNIPYLYNNNYNNYIIHNNDNNMNNIIPSFHVNATPNNLISYTAAEEMNMLQMIRERSQRSLNSKDNNIDDIDVITTNNDIAIGSNNNANQQSTTVLQYNNYNPHNAAITNLAVTDHINSNNDQSYGVMEIDVNNNNSNYHSNNCTSSSVEVGGTTTRTELNIIHEMRAQMNIHRQLLIKKQDQLSLHHATLSAPALTNMTTDNYPNHTLIPTNVQYNNSANKSINNTYYHPIGTHDRYTQNTTNTAIQQQANDLTAYYSTATNNNTYEKSSNHSYINQIQNFHTTTTTNSINNNNFIDNNLSNNNNNNNSVIINHENNNMYPHLNIQDWNSSIQSKNASDSNIDKWQINNNNNNNNNNNSSEEVKDNNKNTNNDINNNSYVINDTFNNNSVQDNIVNNEIDFDFDLFSFLFDSTNS